MMNFKDTLTLLLKSDERFLIDWELSLNHVKDSIDNLDEWLLDLLYNKEQTREKFFEKNKNSDYIKFKSKDFKFYLDENKLDNSYTQFENQIGLFFDNKFLKNRWEVVLNFPFKDCILEWGQSRDDWEDIYFEFNEKTSEFDEKKGKRKEVFFNEVLGRDEIDRLKEDKVLVNWKRFTKNWEEKVWEIKRDENGLIKENLIIKWNNLLALYSLKKEFFWEIKLIYIDPPYNTWWDSFKYNDNFNHSTWLTFMKNRLEVAKDLLRDDWIIFVHCDSNEQAYLKVLMDDVFWRNNFRETITVVNNPRWRDYGWIANMHEFINVYWKSFNCEIFPLLDESKEFPFEDKLWWFEIRELRNRNIKFNDENRPNLCYPFYINPSNIDENWFYEISLEKKDWYIELYPAKSQWIQTVWRWWKDKSLENLNINISWKIMKNWWFQIVERYRWNTRMIRSVWFDKDVNSEKGTLHLKDLFKWKVFDHAKPENTLSRIIEVSTKPWDIVLDYHLWSGTTCSVAHKMWRQYIWVEQMDYIETISVERLKKVIEWEQWWVSKEVKWNWWWDFIYMELKKWNEEAKEKILNFNKLEELEVFFDEMYNKYFLNYNVKVRDFKEKILKDENFRKLSLEKQKKMFISMLDLNQMYVNMSERKDKKFGISEEDMWLSEEFYSLS